MGIKLTNFTQPQFNKSRDFIQSNVDDISLGLATYSFNVGQQILASRSEKQRKQNGQFLTPPEVARFMAQQLGPIKTGDRILDPAIGSGVLTCAIIDRLIAEDQPLEIWLDGYEIDSELAQIAGKVLDLAVNYAATKGIIIHTRVYKTDFILTSLTTVVQPRLFMLEGSNQADKDIGYNQIIANPPYFKLNSNDPRVKAAAGVVKGHTNIYALFLALAQKKLTEGGRACFIVPRSFCSGRYFSSLRQDLIAQTTPLSVHQFESRQDTFKDDAVLQENIIFTFQRRSTSSPQTQSPPKSVVVNISSSKSLSELNNLALNRKISSGQFLGRRFGTLFFRLPTGELDEQIIKIVDSWTGSLGSFGLDVSTGPVVAFRARSWLTDVEAVSNKQAVPLFWLHNVKRQQVEWPVTNGHKLQGISIATEAQSLVIPGANYVLLRRFSAKEEARRLVAGPLLADKYNFSQIGVENHLNYIYRKQGILTPDETVGLSAMLNSSIFDRYFRIVNGNTQVNAAELRALPLPPFELIKQIGREILRKDQSNSSADLEVVVFNALREAGYLPSDFPLIRETRIMMGKIQEAQEALKALGLPPNQQNEISALTLLVLAQLSEETPWSKAKQQSLRIHDILLEIKNRYGREYAENTRETIRRQVIHQFEQAGLVTRNPDDPVLPTNSPRTHYALTPLALKTIRTYNSDKWQQSVQSFIKSSGALFEIYQKSREQHRIPVSQW